MSDNSLEAAFSYHEPPITTILNLSMFLVALNLLNICLDKILYCGLIGQILLGILWGTPGAKWLDRETETAFQQLGYLGLIMLVYEGGLSTSIKAVRENFAFSLCVAATGIGAPIGLSFILMELVGASPLQSFTAGAALSATSLGTTFTILSTTGLITTRLGTVTTTAAMLDDVVGLVMVQIISNLSDGTSNFSAITVIRPIFVSIGFALGLSLLCAFAVGPIFRSILSAKFKVPDFMGTIQWAFIYQTSILVGLVAGASYAGTSSLFAAYLSGAIVAWLDNLIAESKVLLAPSNEVHQRESQQNNVAQSPRTSNIDINTIEAPTGEKVYEKFYRQPVGRILTPLFFASIGFAVPITKMFKGHVVWRGLVYASLMVIGKMVTGIWLMRFSMQPIRNLINSVKIPYPHTFCFAKQPQDGKQSELAHRPDEATAQVLEQHREIPSNQPDSHANKAKTRDNPSSRGLATQNALQEEPQTATTSTSPPKPRSLYPSSVLGLAMVARGEIGYLIASLAQSQGMFGNGSSEISDIYLVVIWAISICTLLGPICVGSLVKHVKKLQVTRGTSGPDPLGVWGV